MTQNFYVTLLSASMKHRAHSWLLKVIIHELLTFSLDVKNNIHYSLNRGWMDSAAIMALVKRIFSITITLGCQDWSQPKNSSHLSTNQILAIDFRASQQFIVFSIPRPNYFPGETQEYSTAFILTPPSKVILQHTHHTVAICWSHEGKLPVMITRGSWSCRLAFAATLLFTNS
jgi:hypothetical protein